MIHMICKKRSKAESLGNTDKQNKTDQLSLNQLINQINQPIHRSVNPIRQSIIELGYQPINQSIKALSLNNALPSNTQRKAVKIVSSFLDHKFNASGPIAHCPKVLTIISEPSVASATPKLE